MGSTVVPTILLLRLLIFLGWGNMIETGTRRWTWYSWMLTPNGSPQVGVNSYEYKRLYRIEEQDGSC